MTKNRTQERKCKGENESVFVYKFCAKINGAEAPSIFAEDGKKLCARKRRSTLHGLHKRAVARYALFGVFPCGTGGEDIHFDLRLGTRRTHDKRCTVR